MSRLFVSSYQTAFVAYLSFLALFYGYILHRDTRVTESPHLYTITALIILAVVAYFCRRAWIFGKRLNAIETQHFTLNQGGNVLELFWPKHDPRCSNILFALAVILVVASLAISVLRIYGLVWS
jgi:hypothetical protein